MSFFYGIYLKADFSASLYPDPITNTIAYQTAFLLDIFTESVSAKSSTRIPAVLITVNQKPTVNIIEGCNAISVMILFMAFVLAFAKAWKKTALFILIGIAIIYIINLVRLVILTLILAGNSPYSDLAHDVLFPAIIYGTVILLWIYWLKKPGKYDRTPAF